MELVKTEIADKTQADLELNVATSGDTAHVVHFYTPEAHDDIGSTIQESIKGPKPTKAGFICSSDVLYSQIAVDPLIDLTGNLVASLHFTAQLDFSVHPIGGNVAIAVNPEDVKLVILFGSRNWNEDVRNRCIASGMDASSLWHLMNDQEDLLKSLKDVPVIGGKPTHPELSIAARGYIVIGDKLVVHTKLIDNSENAGQVFHELHEEVDKSAAKFCRPKFMGLIFGAFGSLQRHRPHHLNSPAWNKLVNEFPNVRFTGFSTTTIYSGTYPFDGTPNKTSVSIIIFGK